MEENVHGFIRYRPVSCIQTHFHLTLPWRTCCDECLDTEPYLLLPLHPGGGTGRPSGSVARAGAVAGRCDEGADDAPREDAPGAAAAPFIEDQRLRTVAAVVATCSVLKLSAVLIAAETSYAFFVLAAAALVQWATLDGTYASLLLGTVVAVAGPLAEIPFEELGCWHYYSPDYFPFGQDLPGISSLTGPCYFAVTQDAQALGRLFDDDERDV